MIEYAHTKEDLPTKGSRIKVSFESGLTLWKGTFTILWKGMDAKYDKNDMFILDDKGSLFKWSEVKSWDFAEKEYGVMADGKSVASGFQFEKDAQEWAEKYRLHHPEIISTMVYEKL